GQQVADPLAALAVPPPAPRALHDRAGRTLEQFDAAARVELLAVAPDQQRFVVEGVALAGGAGHEQLHDALRPGAVMQAAAQFGARLRRLLTEQAVLDEQVRQRDATQAAAALPQERTAIRQGVHGEAPRFKWCRGRCPGTVVLL